MATQFGLTSTGFNPKQQSDIISEIQSSLQDALGKNINLLPQSVYGQIVGIFSEREALVWQLAEAVYSSQYPSGAEGSSVDNILALNNVGRRLSARPTKTAPTNTSGVPGLVFYGTPGTIVPAGSIISVDGNPALQFTTDETATIEGAVNAVQLLTPYAGPPTIGTFSFSIVAPSGSTLTSVNTFNSMTARFSSAGNTTLIRVPATPASGNFRIALGPVATTAFSFNPTAGQIQTAIQALPGYSGVLVTGTSITSGFTIDWGAISQPLAHLNPIKLNYSANPTGGVLQLSLSGNPVPPVAYNATAADLQAAIRTLPGFEEVYVSGSPTAATGYLVNPGARGGLGSFGVTVQPTGATVTVVPTYTLDQGVVVSQSVQALINNLYDLAENNYPYTDVSVTGSFSSGLFTITFGALSPLGGQPASGNQPQNLFSVASNSLQNGSTVVNLNFVSSVTGAPAQAAGTSATCTQTGPNFVPAGFLTVIGSPVSGWTAVDNPLDCITGSNIETDTEALARREASLAAQANGPIQAIAEKVSAVSGVAQAIGFENTSLAANQIISLEGTPTGGSFTLSFHGPTNTIETTAPIPFNSSVGGGGILANTQHVLFDTPPTGGDFTLTFGSQTTASISSSATASDVQTAIQALSGYEQVLVTGSFILGFTIAFGIRTQLPAVATNSLVGTTTITTVPSIQAVINDLPSYDLVTVSGSVAAGFKVAFNGAAGGQAQLLAVATNSLTGVTAIEVAFGLPGKSFEIVVNDNNGQANNLDIAQAIYGSKPAGIQTFGSQTVQIADDFGNPYLINFSRPTEVPFYVVVTLQTDLTTNPAPKFNPQTILAIQEDIVNIGNKTPIGGLVIGFGTDGLIGAFNSVPGILSYTLYFGTSPAPSSNTNVQLQSEEVAQFETFLVQVSYT
jgi:uncharacterized phage protein gp47/JayE